MEVSTQVYYWTKLGMTQHVGQATGRDPERYVTVREAERIATEAHARGWQGGRQEMADEVKRRMG